MSYNLYCDQIEATHKHFAELLFDANAAAWNCLPITFNGVVKSIKYSDVEDYLLERICALVADISLKVSAQWDLINPIEIFPPQEKWDFNEPDLVKNFVSFCGSLNNRVVKHATAMFANIVERELRSVLCYHGETLFLGVKDKHPYVLKQLNPDSDYDNNPIISGSYKEVTEAMAKLDNCILYREKDCAMCAKENVETYMFVNGEEPGENELFTLLPYPAVE